MHQIKAKFIIITIIIKMIIIMTMLQAVINNAN